MLLLRVLEDARVLLGLHLLERRIYVLKFHDWLGRIHLNITQMYV